MSETKILVATARAGACRLQRVLVDHELVLVSTVEEAKHALEQQRFACIILGVQFDESRMLELLDNLRSDGKHRNIPMVCVIGIRGQLSGTALGAFEQAARALQAKAVFDMAEFSDDEAGNRQLRRLIEQQF
jgi:CheY-like chemotaxis protein